LKVARSLVFKKSEQGEFEKAFFIGRTISGGALFNVALQCITERGIELGYDTRVMKAGYTKEALNILTMNPNEMHSDSLCKIALEYSKTSKTDEAIALLSSVVERSSGYTMQMSRDSALSDVAKTFVEIGPLTSLQK